MSSSPVPWLVHSVSFRPHATLLSFFLTHRSLQTVLGKMISGYRDSNFGSSDQVKKRFPTLGHMEEAGIITENERKIIEGLDEKCIQVDSG